MRFLDLPKRKAAWHAGFAGRRNTWRSQILAGKGARLQVRENVQKMMSESSVEEAKEKLQEIEEHEKKLDTDKEEV